MDQQTLISSVVQEVIKRLAPSGGVPVGEGAPAAAKAAAPAAVSHDPSTGRFANVDAAVQTATRAQSQLASAGLKVRDGISPTAETPLTGDDVGMRPVGVWSLGAKLDAARRGDSALAQPRLNTVVLANGPSSSD